MIPIYDDFSISELEDLLTLEKNNLFILWKQFAQYAASEAPLGLINNIESKKQEVENIKNTIKQKDIDKSNNELFSMKDQIESLVSLLDFRANTIFKFMKENNIDNSTIESIKLLHQQHISAIRQGNIVLAHDILTSIYSNKFFQDTRNRNLKYLMRVNRPKILRPAYIDKNIISYALSTHNNRPYETIIISYRYILYEATKD